MGKEHVSATICETILPPIPDPPRPEITMLSNFLFGMLNDAARPIANASFRCCGKASTNAFISLSLFYQRQR
jgi:hypothetical protein